MKRLMFFFLLMAVAALSAAGQVSPKTAELGWLELPSFSEDPEHFFVSHYTEEYWGRQRNYSIYWDVHRQIPIWVAYPLNRELVGRGSRSGAWQYDKFMATKKQPNLRRTYQAGSVEGYIRGHLCPSNDRMRPGMNEQTFYFTNMAPQDPYLNGGLWAWLEEHVQQLALSAQDATENILDPQHRKRKYSLRDIMDAIIYIVKTGCKWRMLPRDFPPYNTVFYYFNKWKLEGVFKELVDTLHVIIRRLMGREDTPSVGIIDSRSIKSSHHVAHDRGIDGNKKIKGRKEHIVVDTLGLPMGVVVHKANIHDSVGAHSVIDAMQGCFPRLKKILADGGKLIDAVRQKLGAEFTVVLRPDESSKKFNVLPLRWIVERSFSWLENFRRIAMDYEFYSDTGEAMVQLAFCRLMYNKIYD